MLPGGPVPHLSLTPIYPIHHNPNPLTVPPDSRSHALRATTRKRIEDRCCLAGRFDLRVVMDDLAVVPFRVSGH